MLLHIYIRHLSPSVSDSQFTAYLQTNYNLFKQNVLVLIFALLNLIWVNIWNHEKNHCKDLGLVKHFAIYHDFNGLNYDLFYFKGYYLRNMMM